MIKKSTRLSFLLFLMVVGGTVLGAGRFQCLQIWSQCAVSGVGREGAAGVAFPLLAGGQGGGKGIHE